MSSGKQSPVWNRTWRDTLGGNSDGNVASVSYLPDSGLVIHGPYGEEVYLDNAQTRRLAALLGRR